MKKYKVLIMFFFACLVLITIRSTTTYAASFNSSDSLVEITVDETVCLSKELLKNENLINLDTGKNVSKDSVMITSMKYSTIELFKKIVEVDKNGKITGKKPGVAIVYIDVEFSSPAGKSKSTNKTQRIPISFIVKKEDTVKYKNKPTEYQLLDRLIKSDMDDVVKLYSCFQWVSKDYYYNKDYVSSDLTCGKCYNYACKYKLLVDQLISRYDLNIKIDVISDGTVDHAWNLIKLSDGKYYIADPTGGSDKDFLVSPYCSMGLGGYTGYKTSEFSEKNYDFLTPVKEYFGEGWYDNWKDMVGQDIMWKR